MTSSTDSAAIFNGTAATIARHFPEVIPVLMAQHLPGPDGRCRSCRSGNRSAPLWPCSLRILAETAARS
jgi:hypothetical protein